MGVQIVAAEIGINEAAERLKAGRLVAFPTETVYGLGANALDARAVAAIFAVKGRPATNPLIVHVASRHEAKQWAAQWPEEAQCLAESFWPGPLTLVVLRNTVIPENVTAGGPTVGLRVPRHPVALALLQQVGLPVAAPSANRSEEISPTTAQHVAESLGPFVEDLLILDGGSCTVGIESTVVDVTAQPCRLLRPGMITSAEIASCVGTVLEGAGTENVARSPGQRRRHYAPRKPVILLSAPVAHREPGAYLLQLPASPARAASRLYAALRALDSDPQVEKILIMLPDNTPEWAGIRDRLTRAAASGNP